MSPIAVVDASALAAIAFGEPAAPDIVRRLENRELVAPRLMAYELANTAWRKTKKYPDRAAAIRAGLERALADDMAIVWSDVEPAAVVDLALAMDLTAYDASYLWLARHLQAELVTLDADLAAAASR